MRRARSVSCEFDVGRLRRHHRHHAIHQCGLVVALPNDSLRLLSVAGDWNRSAGGRRSYRAAFPIQFFCWEKEMSGKPFYYFEPEFGFVPFYFQCGYSFPKWENGHIPIQLSLFDLIP